MTPFTIVNLLELENTAADASSGLEVRFGRGALESAHLGVSHFRYHPGVRSSRAHSHREQEEAYLVVSGSGRVRLDDEVRELRQWDVVRVAPPVVRAFEAGPDGLEIVAVASDRPEGGDGVPAEDVWPD